ncbi:MAG TPA: IPT/TIG domain-containing protein [bacterium]|nr:IPT/TIG domain-containing protein [bacterium]
MKRLIHIASIFLILFLFSSCGGSGGSDFPDDIPTQTNPIVTRVSPDSGPAGTAVTIFGLGFSTNFPNNVVVIGDTASPATGYNLVEPPLPTEIEAITSTVQDGAALGVNSVVVIVYDNVSNADVTFTVTP